MIKKCIWIMSGEASGELYAVDLAKELWKQDPSLKIKGMGGKNLAATGVELLVDSSELGVMGFVEVAKLLPTFISLLKSLVEQAEDEHPDLIITIDYPGFNLRFAEKVHAFGIKTVHLVSPQVWAWGKKRLKTMPKFIDKLLVIFPFEMDVWKESGLDVEFIGHPLVESLTKHKVKIERDKNLVLLLPGSRLSELKKILVPMLKTAKELRKKRAELRFVISTPREKVRSYVIQAIADFGLDFPITVTCNDTVDWLRRAGTGLAASGTVTVQAAILGLPLVVVYKMNFLTYYLMRFLINLPYFTMINIINNRLCYEEFLQGDVNSKVLVPALERILPNGERRDQVKKDMQEMINNLGGNEQVVMKKAAASILEMLKSSENL